MGNQLIETCMEEVESKESILSFLKQLPASTSHFFANLFPIAKKSIFGILLLNLVSKMLPTTEIQTGELLSGVKLITTDMDLQLAMMSRLVKKSNILLQELTFLLDQNSVIPAQKVMSHLKQFEEAVDFVNLWSTFIEEHGHRGSGEIDISNPRFVEDCSMILRILVQSCEHSTATVNNDALDNYETKKNQVLETIQAVGVIVKQEKTLLNQVTFGIWGQCKAFIVILLIHLFRALFSVRETPKYLLVKLFTRIKLALLDKMENSSILSNGVIEQATDIYWLYYEELIYILELYQQCGTLQEETIQLVKQTIVNRKVQHEKNKQFQAPRVVTNYGEYMDVKIKQEFAKEHQQHYDANVLVGSGVSSGVAEGRVCIVLDANSANLKPGQVLVVRQSDPGYNPLFLNCVALVSETGGYLTHGSVVARELNLPAVVGIDNACTLLKNGQLVRVDGEAGVVSILE